MQPAHSHTETLTTAVSDPGANPLAIASAMDEATNYEWRDWLPETCRDFAGLNEDDVQQLDKLMAVQVALTNPDVYDSWPLFVSCVIAFNHRRVNFEFLDKPSVVELAWGCSVLNKLNPSGIYSPSVLRYIATTMMLDGLTFFPWAGDGGYVLGAEGETWSHGLVDAAAVRELGTKVKKLWDDGELTTLEPSDVDPTNPLHVQLSELVRAQKYIRSQKPVIKERR